MKLTNNQEQVALVKVKQAIYDTFVQLKRVWWMRTLVRANLAGKESERGLGEKLPKRISCMRPICNVKHTWQKINNLRRFIWFNKFVQINQNVLITLALKRPLCTVGFKQMWLLWNHIKSQQKGHLRAIYIWSYSLVTQSSEGKGRYTVHNSAAHTTKCIHFLHYEITKKIYSFAVFFYFCLYNDIII